MIICSRGKNVKMLPEAPCIAPRTVTMASLVLAFWVLHGSVIGGVESDGAKASGGASIVTCRVKLKTPKSGKDRRVSRPLDEVSCSLYVPPEAKVLRGVVFNPFPNRVHIRGE